MSDVELERLAAEVRATDDPVARLRLAAALERVGRRDEAVEVLQLGAKVSLDVRRALGAFPAWSRREANAGRTRWVDVAPVVREPRVTWKRDLSPLAVVANPLAVVVVEDRRLYVLQPWSGTERFSFAADGRCGVELAGEVVLSERPPHLEAHDLVTGEPLWRHPVDRPLVPGSELLDHEFHWLRAGSQLVIVDESSVAAHAFADPRRPPAKKRTWSVPCTRFYRDQGRETFPEVRATDDLVLVFESFPNGAETRALGSSGGIAWRREGYPHVATLDAHGGAAIATLEMQLHLWDSAGRERTHPLALESWPEVAVLAPDRVVVRAHPRSRIIDRATGALVHELRAAVRFAAAQDVLYTASAGRGVIVARSLRDGRKLWTARSPLEAPHLVPLHGRLVGYTRAGVFCLDVGA